MMRVFSCLALISSMSMVYGETQSTTYEVRTLRRHQRNHVTGRQGRQGPLTFSDDGRSKILTAFFLDIFETRGQIAENSIPLIRLAMNNFLLAEMNAIYQPRYSALEAVGTSLIGYPSIIPPSGNRKLKSGKMGTEMLMEVKLSFDYEPSPDISELEIVIREVMSDLGYFVTNLTRFAAADFKDVTEAYRREIPTAAPTGSLAPSSSPLQQSAISDVQRDGDIPPKDDAALTPEQIVVPATLMGATFLALLLFLLVRRRRRSNPDLSKSGDQIITDIEGGGYSFDKSLDSSRPPSPEFPSSSVSELGSQDSVFSDSIVDASKRLKPTKGANTASSQVTVPSSNNRMYKLLNFVSENEDLYAETNNPTAGRPQPPSSAFDKDAYAFGDANQQTVGRPHSAASAFERDAYSIDEMDESQGSSKNSFADIAAHAARTGADTTGNDETNVQRQSHLGRPPRSPNRPETSKSRFADIANFAACTSNGGGRDPTPRNADLEKKKNQSAPSGGGLLGMFQCGPTEAGNKGVKQDQDQQQQRVGRSPERRAQTGNGNQDIFRPRSRSGTPSKRRSGSQSRSRSRSRNPTPTRSRQSTPTNSRPSTPTNDGRSTPDRNRNSSTSPSASNQPRASTPNKSKGSTPERRMGKYGADEQENNGGSRGFMLRPNPTNAHSSYDPQNQRHPFQEVTLRKPNIDDENAGPEDQDAKDRRRLVFVGGMTHEIFYPHGGRRHAGNNGVDGSAMYQANAMDPSEWSYKSFDNNSVGNSTISDGGALPEPVSRQRGGTPKKNETAPKIDAIHSLEEDTSWIEKRIAAAKQYPKATNISIPIPSQHSTDSLSYASNDNDVYQINSPSELYSSKDDSVMSSIVCRDCYAPPGKLNIIIHSTKDGPAVHTVKEGSSLEGHLFPGDLIISVDNVDTRSFTAEHVMKMMAAKSAQERKITVLHFEEESQI